MHAAVTLHWASDEVFYYEVDLTTRHYITFRSHIEKENGFEEDVRKGDGENGKDGNEELRWMKMISVTLRVGSTVMKAMKIAALKTDVIKTDMRNLQFVGDLVEKRSLLGVGFLWVAVFYLLLHARPEKVIVGMCQRHLLNVALALHHQLVCHLETYNKYCVSLLYGMHLHIRALVLY